MACMPNFRVCSFVFYLLALLTSRHIAYTTAQDVDGAALLSGLPTVTVRGFLNFKTTVDGTVIVFTPASDATAEATKPTNPPLLTTKAILHSNALDSRDGVEIQDLAYTQPPSLDPIKSNGDLDHQAQRAKESFQHISDNAVLPSTVQTNNDLETDTKKAPAPQNQYPTGLVTVLGGTHIESGSTTIFETKVIGTYIDGKYAQILQSTSKIIIPTTAATPVHVTTPNPAPSASITPETSRIPFQDTSKTVNFGESSKTVALATSSKTVAFSTPTKTIPTLETISKDIETSSESYSAFEPSLVTDTGKVDIATSHAVLHSSFRPPVATPLKTDRPTQTLDSVRSSSYITAQVPRHVYTTVTRLFDEDNTLISSNRTLRPSSTRIRFIAPRRPSQSVRLNRFKVKLTLRNDSPDGFDLTPPPDEEEAEEEPPKEDEEIETQEDTLLPLDPARVVFKETTITSEVTLHVGRRKSVRTLTITTSVPLTLNPTEIGSDVFPEITEAHAFPVIESEHEEEEITQSVVSRTFTTTERTWMTSLLPVFDGHATSFHTVTESFFILKIITAYRTLPPGDVTVLDVTEDQVPDVAPTLDVAANVQPSIVQSPPKRQVQQKPTLTTADPEPAVQPSIPLPVSTSGNAHPQLANPLISLGHALSNNPLAAVYLGLQQLNAQMTLYSTITQTSVYVTTDTVYNTKTIRFYDGRSTRFRTISEPISTKKRTVTTTMTSVQPYINTQALQQQQQLQKLIAATQLSPPQPQFSTITSTYTTVTTATSLSTRIYTLIYNGFSTKFRTVTSSTLYPTTVTVTSTKEVPLVATAPPVPFAYPYPA